MERAYSPVAKVWRAGLSSKNMHPQGLQQFRNSSKNHTRFDLDSIMWVHRKENKRGSVAVCQINFPFKYITFCDKKGFILYWTIAWLMTHVWIPFTGVTAPYSLQSTLSGSVSTSFFVYWGNGLPPLYPLEYSFPRRTFC